MIGASSTASLKRGNSMSDIKRKRVRISSQRQFTIPKDFYDALDFKDEAFVEFNAKSKQLSIKPADENDVVDFSVDILRDLQEQGYTGEDLVQKFVEVKSQIPYALEQVKQEALNSPKLTNQSLGEYLDSLDDRDEDENDE